MKVSIILPCFNSEKYLDECIDSIVNQTFKDYELIIIDNGSIDETKEKIRYWITFYKNINIRFIDMNKTLGDSSAGTINLGLGLAKGEYITWISSDDYYSNNYSLKTMVDFLEKNIITDCGMVSGRYLEINGKMEFIKGVSKGIITFDDIKKTNCIGGGFLFKRKCFDKIGYMREDLIGADDWDYWIRLAKYFTIYKISDIVYCWRKHENNMSANPLRIEEINNNVRKVMNGDY